MGFRHCGREDPFTAAVRRTYGANVVRAPRAGINPLDVLAVADRRVQPWGAFESLVESDTPLNLPDPVSSPVADFAGTRSAGVKLGLAFNLTSTFLTALGAPIPGAAIDLSAFDQSSSLSFEVRDVTKSELDIGALGRALVAARIAESPATRVFFDRESGVRMLVITRTLKSASFALRTTATSNRSATLALDGIADVVGKASLNIACTKESTDALAFTGPQPVTFAFATIACLIHAGTREFHFGLEDDRSTLAPGDGVPLSPIPIIDEDGLLSFDED